MAVLKVEVVVRAVQVRRHHRYVVGAVLQVEALAHLQSRDLRYRVGLVRVFKRGGQKAVLLHRLGGLPRVDARAAQEQELPHSVTEALPDHVLLDLEVLPDEVGTVLQVRHDPADVRRRKHHGIGSLPVKELSHRSPVKQV